MMKAVLAAWIVLWLFVVFAAGGPPDGDDTPLRRSERLNPPEVFTIPRIDLASASDTNNSSPMTQEVVTDPGPATTNDGYTVPDTPRPPPRVTTTERVPTFSIKRGYRLNDTPRRSIWDILTPGNGAGNTPAVPKPPTVNTAEVTAPAPPKRKPGRPRKDKSSLTKSKTSNKKSKTASRPTSATRKANPVANTLKSTAPPASSPMSHCHLCSGLRWEFCDISDANGNQYGCERPVCFGHRTSCCTTMRRALRVIRANPNLDVTTRNSPGMDLVQNVAQHVDDIYNGLPGPDDTPGMHTVEFSLESWNG